MKRYFLNRTAIDNNLCEDLDRAWRLFREVSSHTTFEINII